jgi:hypothetical protein
LQNVCELASSPHIPLLMWVIVWNKYWMLSNYMCHDFIMHVGIAPPLRSVRRKIIKPPLGYRNYAFVTVSLCLSANWIILRKYILNESDLHLKRNLITLIEWVVNLFNPSFFLMLCTTLAASWRIVLIRTSSMYIIFLLFGLSVKIAIGLSYFWLRRSALCLILLHTLIKQSV